MQKWWEVTGVVVEVDSKHVFLQIPELNEGKLFSVEITEKTPGWLLQKGMLFIVNIPFTFESMKLDDIVLSHFRPHPYAHMTAKELARKLLALSGGKQKKKGVVL